MRRLPLSVCIVTCITAMFALSGCERAALELPKPKPAASATTSTESDAARRIEADLRFLADDLLEGREAGTRGFDLAALYVAERFRAIGLAPAGDNGSTSSRVPLLKGDARGRGCALRDQARGQEHRVEVPRTSSCRA